MRHGDKINNLGRTASHRRALLANLAIALIEHKRITTTVAKAKALRRYVEPLVTKAKDNTTHSRRVVFGYLQNKDAITMPMLVSNLLSGYTVDYGMLMLGVFICTIPTAIIFFAFQKSFTEGMGRWC